MSLVCSDVGPARGQSSASQEWYRHSSWLCSEPAPGKKATALELCSEPCNVPTFHFLKTNELGTAIQVTCSRQSSCAMNTCHLLSIIATSFPPALKDMMLPPLLLKIPRYATLPQFQGTLCSCQLCCLLHF